MRTKRLGDVCAPSLETSRSVSVQWQCNGVRLLQLLQQKLRTAGKAKWDVPHLSLICCINPECMHYTLEWPIAGGKLSCFQIDTTAMSAATVAKSPTDL